MLVDSNHIVPITKLQKELTQTVRKLSETGEAYYILKNNVMEAAMIPFQEYEFLMNLEEMFEYFEIESVLKDRLDKYDPTKNIPWSQLRDMK